MQVTRVLRRTPRKKLFLRRQPLRLELLERRDTPSSSFLADVFLPSIRDAAVARANDMSSLALTPAIVRHAYGFDQLNFNGVAADGSGQTIAIVTAFNQPQTQRDLSRFDKQFGIAEPPSFTQIALGSQTTDAGWAMETNLDVQWAHAIAPGANLLVVGAASNSLSDMMQAVDYARNQPGVSVVSMSWGVSEFAGQTRYDGIFGTPAGHDPVSFVAASGDFGAGVEWPASSPTVLAVGGTTLKVDATGNYINESAWSGSGGGMSEIYTSAPRSVPDVSYSASPDSGFYIYNSSSAKPSGSWYRVGGTSAGAPQWAALVAITNQGRVLSGSAPIPDARAAVSNLPDSAFHDVTTGSNGFSATVGPDLATGRGSPNAVIAIATMVSQNMAGSAKFVGPLPAATTVSAGKTTPPKPINIKQIGGAFVQTPIPPQFFPNQIAPIGGSSFAPVTRADPLPTTPAIAPPLFSPPFAVSPLDLSRFSSGSTEEQPGPGGDNGPAAPVTPDSGGSAQSNDGASTIVVAAYQSGAMPGGPQSTTGAHLLKPLGAAEVPPDDWTGLRRIGGMLAIFAGAFGGYLMWPGNERKAVRLGLRR